MTKLRSGENFQTWKRIVEINLTGTGKETHLTENPLNTMIND